MDIQQALQQVKNDPQLVQRILQSPDGQRLMQLLTAPDGGNALQQAASAASGGSTTQMIGMLKKVMQSPEGAALVSRLGKSMQE